MEHPYPHYPPAESVDALGRTFSTVIGYSETCRCTPIPVGTRVRLMPDEIASRNDRVEQICNGHLYGKEAIVTAFEPGQRYPEGRLRFWEKDYVRVRLVKPLGPWEPYVNYRKWHVAWVEVLEVGTGSIVPGSYELTKEEILDERYAQRDHRHEGWSNPPTCLASLYLDNDRHHQAAVLAMVRKDGSINPSRLKTYFSRSGLHIDDWSWYPDTFPEVGRYRYSVNWQEIAGFFADKVKEQRAYTLKAAA